MQPVTQIKIMVFGTFDILHRGHINFFKQARALAENPYLIASIARDRNVERIKGQRPWHSQKERFEVVEASKFVDKAVLGDEQNYLDHIVLEAPQIIALGYDQHYYTSNLEENLKKRGLCVIIKRLKPYKDNIYKSSLLKAKGNNIYAAFI